MHPVATGMTGLISRSFGVHPFIAATAKYAVLLAVAFGSYKAWEHKVVSSANKDAVIEQQNDVIENQGLSIQNMDEDQRSKDVHTEQSNDREEVNYDRAIRLQSQRIAKLERDNDILREAADNNPCLREPWPDSLQRRGGFDLNQGRSHEDTSDQTDQDRGVNTD